MKNLILVVVCSITLVVYGQKPERNTIPDELNFTNLFNTSMADSVSCYRIPALVTAPNGDLIAAIDERVPSCGDLKWSKEINIVIRRSSDNGKTWSAIERVVDFPYGQSASDPSMIVDNETNEIFMFYSFMDLDKELNVYYLHVTKSSDNGKTWSEPEDITSQITKPEWHNDFKFITSGRGIQTKDGLLLHCMVNLESGMHVFGSDDHGKTWLFIDTPLKPADESKIVELVDGTLMVNARVNKASMRYIHTSKDSGKTWTTQEEPALIDPGCNASIIRYTSIEDGYKKNRLLFSNANSIDKRENMTVKISYDEGKTWSKGKTVYAGSSAYSSLTILKNGDIGLFFEKDDYTENSFVSFSLEWLTDGEDRLEKK
ncbi:sialidase family protein [Aureibaculum sp. 2210JD6-5]|uniref:sialidase family protein n=1 Tax=Aureibaculum sp. 2210JD6-5 TaxID=3103957 RepID=UPI002AAE650C|nr:sialidase family protein [Aureibaculum sp. 2210JD6-5]MDY7394739.1 sialidase family protein [Aureibaculum sp. 2210JD6-5]